jgi:hypothetical protein
LDTGAAHGFEAGRFGGFEVVSGACAELTGEGDAAVGAKLLGVQAQLQAVVLGGGEDGARLGEGEGMVVAEDIAEAGEAVLGDVREQIVGDEAEIAWAVVLELRRHGMRSQQRGNDAQRGALLERAEDVEDLQFGVAGEAVAGLGFNGGGAATEEPVSVVEGGYGEVFEALVAGLADSGEDSTACGSDLLIGLAGDALLELGDAVAAEDEMGVGVDEAGEDGAFGGVDDGMVRGKVTLESGVRADGEDAAVSKVNGRVMEDAELLQLPACARPLRASKSQKLAAMDDERVFGGRDGVMAPAGLGLCYTRGSGG